MALSEFSRREMGEKRVGDGQVRREGKVATYQESWKKMPRVFSSVILSFFVGMRCFVFRGDRYFGAFFCHVGKLPRASFCMVT